MAKVHDRAKYFADSDEWALRKQRSEPGSSSSSSSRAETVFGGDRLYDVQTGQFACPVRPHSFWKGGRIKLVEINHSDIFWLGKDNDMKT